MNQWIDARLEQSIEDSFQTAMHRIPEVQNEIISFLSSLSNEEQTCMKFIYAYLPVQDIIVYTPEFLFQYTEAALLARRSLTYVSSVPAELFLTYVLPARINNEALDGSRMAFYNELYPRVCAKDMTAAVLEVNYWCYEKATYTPSDARTLAPSSVIRRARGRCGEESTLTAAALRSIGIPSRQCYAPRWAHCDDNHAWVEVWVDGCWHYIGACEPEPLLDKGWFTAAASKAMLIRSKAFSNLISGVSLPSSAPQYTLVNSLNIYAHTTLLTVTVQENGRPLSGIMVSFEIINYAELYPLYTQRTNEEGKAEFTSGCGDLYVTASGCTVSADGQIITRRMGRKVDLRHENELCFHFQFSSVMPSAENTRGSFTAVEEFDLVPPTEHVSAASSQPTAAMLAVHKARLEKCELLRTAYESSFTHRSEDPEHHFANYLSLAGGNAPELNQFLAIGAYSVCDKLSILSTLRPKDFTDITSAVLCDALECAVPYKTQWPKTAYTSCLLAPRIADEMLVPCRNAIKTYFAEQDLTFDNPSQLWGYLNRHLRLVDEVSIEDLQIADVRCLILGICPVLSLPLLFVAACRALGFPARLNPVDGHPEYLLPGGNPEFHSPFSGTEVCPDCHRLTLLNPAGKTISYGTNLTIGRLERGNFLTLDYGSLVFNEQTELLLPNGIYRIITSVRQIDGTVSAKLYTLSLCAPETATLSFAPDKTSEKLLHVPLKDTIIRDLNGKEESLLNQCAAHNTLLLFAEPGKEPTEHLLQELLEEKDHYNAEQIKIVILMKNAADAQNETLQAVLRWLAGSTLHLFQEESYLFDLHRSLSVGDERLPFAVAVSDRQQALFAFANYNIGTAQTVRNIFQTDLSPEENFS